MKKFITILMLVICCTLATQAQTNGTEKHYIYATIYLKNGVNIDYGSDKYDDKYRTPDGKKVKTLTAAMNNMAVDGWEVASSYSVAGLEVVIMRKAVTKEEQQKVANEGKKE